MRWNRPYVGVDGLLGLSVLPFCANVARADAEETERRLRAVGVSESLREKTHKAIDRGVAFLVKRQQIDGWFVEHAPSHMSGSYMKEGVTLLCTLALRHAGIPAAEGAIKTAIAALLANERRAIFLMEKNVYDAGLALMLFAAVPGHEDFARRIVSALTRGLDDRSKLWGYVNTAAADSSGVDSSGTAGLDIRNLSTSQFAALGLAAARRIGIPVPVSVWIRHAEGLCALQTPTGSFSYEPTWQSTGGAMITDTCTYMGLGNLLLAAQALAGAKEVPAGLSERVAIAVLRARGALERAAARTLADPMASGASSADDSAPGSPRGLGPTGPAATPVAPGFGAYYALYALEKACIFGDIETIDSVDPLRKAPNSAEKSANSKLAWYPAGAKWLISVQRQDGGWAPNPGGLLGGASSEIDTSLALLFLLRSPAAFHPTTPAQVDAKPLGAGTESDPTSPMK